MLTILKAPHVTEKTAMGAHACRQYAFKVISSANKIEIREAIEQLFKVTVKSISVCNMKGKRVRFGRRLGQRKDWKKAYVTLAQDQEIDLTGQVG